MLEIFPATRILYSRVILAVFSFFSGLLKGKGPFERRRRHRGDSSQQKEYKHSALLERTETKRSEEREREEGKTRQPRRGQGGTLAMASTVDPRARVRVSPALQRGPDVAPLAAWPEAGRGPTGFRTIPPLLAALGAVDGPCWRPTRPPGPPAGPARAPRERKDDLPRRRPSDAISVGLFDLTSFFPSVLFSRYVWGAPQKHDDGPTNFRRVQRVRREVLR